jgi:hypothetical protein
MCCYSMISGWGQKQIWPPDSFYVYPQVPTFIPNIESEAEQIRVFKKLLDQAAEMDKVSGQAECEDPEKVKFVGKLLQRLEDLEKQVREMKLAGKEFIKNKERKKKITAKPLKLK